MALFKPTIYCNNVTEINLDLLKKLDVKLILLDVDNTIVSYRDKEPINGSINWINTLKNNGYMVYIVSNNFEKRVSGVANTFALKHVSFALKPLTRGFLRAKKICGVSTKECLVVGDQVFTDILGANLAGMKSVLLDPVELETNWFITSRRVFERSIRKNTQKYKGN